MSEDEVRGIEVNPKSFSQNGLIVISLLGGFVFTGLILVLQTGRNVNMNAVYPQMFFGIRASDAYFFVMVVMLAVFSFFCLIVSMAMLIVSSAKDINMVRNTESFVGRSMVALIGAFGGMLSWLVIPSSPYIAITVMVLIVIILNLYLRVAHRDENMRLKPQKEKTSNASKDNK